jgi:hypothetical protein
MRAGPAQFENLKPTSRHQHEHEFNKTEDLLSKLTNVPQLTGIPKTSDINNYQNMRNDLTSLPMRR